MHLSSPTLRQPFYTARTALVTARPVPGARMHDRVLPA